MKMIFKLTHMKVGKLVFAILNSVQVQIIPLHQGILLMKHQTLTTFLANSCNGRLTYLCRHRRYSTCASINPKKEEKQISSPHLLQTLTIEQIAIVALSWACLQL